MTTARPTCIVLAECRARPIGQLPSKPQVVPRGGGTTCRSRADVSAPLSSQTIGDSRGDATAVALVASGNEWSLRSLESILGAQGIKVLRAQSAEEAFTKAESNAVHAV